MAITILDQPDQHHPAYNPVVYVLDSTLKTQPGFRYVFRIYDAGTTTNPLAEVRVAPRPGDGYGYVDISKFLQSRVDKTDPFFTTTFINANTSSIYNYDIHFGEEYEIFYEFDDFFFNNLTPIPAGQNRTSIANTGTLVPLGPAWPFVNGDQVVVSLNAGPVGDNRDLLIGVFNVDNAVGLPGGGFAPREIVLSLGWIGTGTGLPGTVRYADGRKTLFFNPVDIILNRITYNAGFSFPAFQVYDQTPYLPADPTRLFMTSIPRDCFQVYPWQELYHQILTGPNVTNLTYINFETSDGDTFKDSIASVLPADELQFDVSPNITWPTPTVGSTGPVVKPTTEWYEYWLDDCPPVGPDCCQIQISYFYRGAFIVETPTFGGFTSDGYCWFYWNDGVSNLVLFFDNAIDGNGTNRWVIIRGATTPGGWLFSQRVGEWLPFSPAPPCPPIGGPDPDGWVSFGEFGSWTTFPIEEPEPCTSEITERLRIYIKRGCVINATQVLFMDRLGSWSSYAFPLRTLERGTVERRQYRKEMGQINSSNEWFYNPWDSGLTNFHIKHSKELILNTDFMPDCMSVYFQELITTPYAFIKFDPDQGDWDPTKWYAIQVLDTSWETVRQKNKKMIRYTIRIKAAVDNPINI
jgi:hypothetical protein